MSYPAFTEDRTLECGCTESAGQWFPCAPHWKAERIGASVLGTGCACLYHPDGTVTRCSDGPWLPCTEGR